MNPFRTGKLVLFQVEYNRDWNYFEIFFFILIGVFGGLYGEYVVRFNLQVQRFRRKHLSNFGVSEAVILAVLTASVSFFNRFMRIDMTEALEMLFQQCDGASDDDVLCQSRMQWHMILSLLLATVLRFCLVILSYGCKVPAGIFIPSMAVGATFGRMVGIFVKVLQTSFPSLELFASCNPHEPCITPGTYAMLGAAAGLAGVTRITVAVVVIMFELTGALTYILPIMLVVGISKLVADLNGKGGVADRVIKFNGYPFLEEEEHVFGITVGSLMTKMPDVLYAEGTPLNTVKEYLTQKTYRGFPVVASKTDLTIQGYVERTYLSHAMSNMSMADSQPANAMCTFQPRDADEFAITTAQVPVSGISAPAEVSGTAPLYSPLTEESLDVGTGAIDFGPWVDPTPLIVQPEMDLEVVSDLFKRLGPRVILVAKNGMLQGLVTVKDLLRHIALEERKRRNDRSMPNPSDGADADFSVGTGALEEILNAMWAWAKHTFEIKAPAHSTSTPAHVPLTSVTTLYADE